MTLIFIDTETTGLDPSRHGIIQIAWIIEKNGVVQDERVYDICPEPSVDISLAALETNGFTLERIKKGKSITVALAALKELLVVNISDIKAVPVGHRVQFDIDFLKSAADRNRELIHYYLDYKRSIDTHAVLQWYGFIGKVKMNDYKLETACEHFKIKIKAHDALEDVRATRKLFNCLQSFS